ncbi:cobalamin biosynthesis protein CobN [Endozoicomonas sp. OPT23]|uniref:cobaltochelatase subunit CobN n=1 Tax=Endozoicomonas sp. OPT23 TaxID=2072845 RepID=UPI00129A3097|nr:cobaltochelatase subunit CobN [Endozoicomonas sp. OPT23]MRI31938.1 cobalamin biosynthesis protein CobN [Endozoicomonas sp. OPT23]
MTTHFQSCPGQCSESLFARCLKRLSVLFLFLFLAVVRPAFASELFAIVSDRSAADLASGAHAFLEKNTSQNIQIRSVSQINEMTDEQLGKQLQQTDSLLIAAVFGEPVERLLAAAYPERQKRLVLSSDRRLYALNNLDAEGDFSALSPKQLNELLKNSSLQLLVQQNVFPEFERWLQARAYWTGRGKENLGSLWRFLATGEIREPVERESVRLYLNTKSVKFDQLSQSIDRNKSTLFILDQDSGDRPGDWDLHQALCKESELQCISLLAEWGQASVNAVEKIKELAPKKAPWVVLSLQDFVIGGGEAREPVTQLFQSFNVPVFKGIRQIEMTPVQWQLSRQGIATDSVHYRVAMPEIQGISQPMVLALASPASVDSLTGVRIVRTQPQNDQVEQQLARIKSWMKLKTTDNFEKRIGVIYYNHPPGRHNIGADNLNVPESLFEILQSLKAEGYDTGDLPKSPEALLDLLQEKGVNLPQDRKALEAMAPKIAGVSTEEYQQWFATLPDSIQQEMVDGPLGYLHSRFQTIVAQPELAGNLQTQKVLKGLVESTLTDLEHVLDGVRVQDKRRRALALLHQLETSYGKVLANPASRQNTQYLTQASKLVKAIVEMNIEGLRGWGAAPGRSMVWESRMLIPGLQFGKVFLGPQPPRGWELNEELLHANMSFPPPHQYMGFYYYLKNVFSADALIHVGRHSTYEFLPRRSVGLGADDYPQQMVGDLPSIYPYIVDGVGEGIQAKRRGLAVMIDHLTPPLAVTDLYDDLLSLRQLIESAEAASDDATRKLAVKSIREQIDATGLRDELIASMDEELKVRGIDFDQVEDDFLLHEVGHYLTKIQESFMPLGLHVFGRDWDEEAVDTMLASMKQEDDYAKVNQWRKALIESPEAEMSSLMNALEGGFVAPGKGNDPVKTPEALPTGRNFHALDGSLLPTTIGHKVGVELAEKVRENPATEFDKKQGVILWASDAVRDEGAMIAFGMDLLGIKPVWNSRGIVQGIERIDLDDKRKQRLDVLFTTSGLFRDLYGQQLEWLDQSILLALAGSGETIRKDYPALSSALTDALKPLGEGNHESSESLTVNRVANNWVNEARQLLTALPESEHENIGRRASLRIFGTAPGSYGAGINRLVERSGSWQERKELGDAFVKRMGHAYGMTSSEGGSSTAISAQDDFVRQLEQVGQTYLGRASNLYGLIDNNDAFDYLGGLNLAVETVSGKAPDSYVIQHARTDDIRLDPLESALMGELRGRFLNPQWIKPLMDEGYAGARTMGSEFVEYLWGWQVTSPEIVKSWVWDEVKAVYLDDKLELGLDQFLESGHNNQVRTNIMAVMLVAAGKGFWQADPETLRELSNEFAKSIIENGIPGSGHTHPNHPVYQQIMPLLDDGTRTELTRLLEASRLPEIAQPAVDTSVSRIQEIKLDTDDVQEQSKEVESTENKESRSVEQPVENETDQNTWYLLIIVFLLLSAGIIRGRRGAK